jgi:hypothetical protein
MDKGPKDKLVRSPGQNGGQDAQKKSSLKNWRGRDEQGDPGKDVEEAERDLQVLGVRRWREVVIDKKKNGRIVFDRPKPTAGCSANGRRIYQTSLKISFIRFCELHFGGKQNNTQDSR